MKSIHEMIDKCQPNVVLVEKSVSRDMQEFLLAKGVTLIFDMKLTRLSRIARCIGSPLISCADILRNPKLMKCDMFHIEKFFEEHNGSNEGGHRSSKTLMFLEGFPKPLGCTVSLIIILSPRYLDIFSVLIFLLIWTFSSLLSITRPN